MEMVKQIEEADELAKPAEDDTLKVHMLLIPMWKQQQKMESSKMWETEWDIHMVREMEFLKEVIPSEARGERIMTDHEGLEMLNLKWTAEESI